MQAPGDLCYSSGARRLAGVAKVLREADVAMFCFDSHYFAWTVWSFACRCSIKTRPARASPPRSDVRSRSMLGPCLEQTCPYEGCSSCQVHRAQFSAEPGGFWCCGVQRGADRDEVLNMARLNPALHASADYPQHFQRGGQGSRRISQLDVPGSHGGSESGCSGSR